MLRLPVGGSCPTERVEERGWREVKNKTDWHAHAHNDTCADLLHSWGVEVEGSSRR